MNVEVTSVETDLYKILDVPPDASSATIKKAYKKAMHSVFPDRELVRDPEGTQRWFDGLSEAYATLSDPEKRRAYDRTRL